MFHISLQCLRESLPSQYLLIKGQQLKHQNNMLNLLKINNKDTRTTSLTVEMRVIGFPDQTASSNVMEQVTTYVLEVADFYVITTRGGLSRICIFSWGGVGVFKPFLMGSSPIYLSCFSWKPYRLSSNRTHLNVKLLSEFE